MTQIQEKAMLVVLALPQVSHTTRTGPSNPSHTFNPLLGAVTRLIPPVAEST